MSDTNKPLIIGIIIASVAVVIIAVAVILLVVLKKKGKRIRVDDAFTDNILKLLGGKENIRGITVDNGRLKFEVADLEKADLNGLKELSTAGVFVTGNIIKVLFKLESMDIKKAVEAKMK